MTALRAKAQSGHKAQVSHQYLIYVTDKDALLSVLWSTWVFIEHLNRLTDQQTMLQVIKIWQNKALQYNTTSRWTGSWARKEGRNASCRMLCKVDKYFLDLQMNHHHYWENDIKIQKFCSKLCIFLKNSTGHEQCMSILSKAFNTIQTSVILQQSAVMWPIVKRSDSYHLDTDHPPQKKNLHAVSIHLILQHLAFNS